MDKIQYTFNWGDGESKVSESEFLPSGMIFSTIKSWLEPGKYVITVKANDNKTDISSNMTIFIDAIEVKSIGYFTDENSDGKYDLFHQNKTGIITKLKLQPNGNYLIDCDGDGEFDFEYNLETDELFNYNPNESNFILIIVAILSVLSLLIIIIYGIKRLEFEKKLIKN